MAAVANWRTDFRGDDGLADTNAFGRILNLPSRAGAHQAISFGTVEAGGPKVVAGASDRRLGKR